MNNDKLLTVSHSPHLRHEDNTRTVMSDVIIALLPSLIWATYIFGARALIITAVSVASCVIFEALFCFVCKKPLSVGDFSAVVTGLLLAFTLPAACPVWLPAVGAFVAIIIAKQLFGGIGKNLLNPALTARVILGIVFPSASRYTAPFESLPLFASASDVPAAQTTLDSLSQGVIPQISVFDMFIGNRVGAMGEVSALLLLAGGLYLLARKVISLHIPLSFAAAVAVVAYFFPMNTFKEEFMLYQLLSGGVILGAVFLASDCATSPLTSSGKIVYGALCGVITMVIRYLGGFEGVPFAILIANLATPIIDKLTVPLPFGAKKSKKKEKI